MVDIGKKKDDDVMSESFCRRDTRHIDTHGRIHQRINELKSFSLITTLSSA